MEVIIICVLLLIAYLFEINSSRIRIPPVILLLALGFITRRLTILAGIALPDLTVWLRSLGSIGLILIVLEGALELEADRSKIPLVRKSFFLSLLPLLAIACILGACFQYYFGAPFRMSLLNAIPLCVISSSVAIPSVRNFTGWQREMVVYETSFSDVLGVLFFNFVALNSTFHFGSVIHFIWQLLLIIVISVVSILLLSLLLNKIAHPVKYGPLVLIVIVIYHISKEFHLPGLIFIVVFGLFLGNFDHISAFRQLPGIKAKKMEAEVTRFRDVVVEATFLARALFFILFGYVIRQSEITDTATLGWAVLITAGIFVLRAVTLKICRLNLSPLLFIAPRGLITILLFLSIPASEQLPFMSRSLIVQVIVLTAFVMMLGVTMAGRRKVSAE
jgi:Kef-type K+ transport system membrane component KefB